MIQLTRTGLKFRGNEDDVRRLHEQFQRDHFLVLSRLIDPELLEQIMERVDAASFPDYGDDGITSQVMMDDPLTFGLLEFLVNIPAFQRLIERITGCPRIGNFRGRVYRMLPSNRHRIKWHDDVVDHRLIAFSLNLGRKEFKGGALQIRRYGSETLLQEVRNTAPGGAVVFRISDELEHRVLEVEGDTPRTAMAGWFRWAEQDFHTATRKAAAELGTIRPA